MGPKELKVWEQTRGAVAESSEATQLIVEIHMAKHHTSAHALSRPRLLLHRLRALIKPRNAHTTGN